MNSSVCSEEGVVGARMTLTLSVPFSHGNVMVHCVVRADRIGGAACSNRLFHRGDLGIALRRTVVEQHVHGECIARGEHVASSVDPLHRCSHGLKLSAHRRRPDWERPRPYELTRCLSDDTRCRRIRPVGECEDGDAALGKHQHIGAISGQAPGVTKVEARDAVVIGNRPQAVGARSAAAWRVSGSEPGKSLPTGRLAYACALQNAVFRSIAGWARRCELNGMRSDDPFTRTTEAMES
jgi:hypothetical protein